MRADSAFTGRTSGSLRSLAAEFPIPEDTLIPMRIAIAALFTSSVAAFASSAAHAGLVPPGEDRFEVQSTIYVSSGVPSGTVSNYADVDGTINAELDSALAGLASTTLDGQVDHLTISSRMAIKNTMYLGESYGSAYYHIDGTAPVMVNWSWLNLSSYGGWQVYTQDATGAYTVLVAALEFSNNVFTSRGGTFSETASGTDSLNLAAGDYQLVAYYSSVTMPSTSQVTFSFGAIPAPGAASFAVAGVLRRRRRA
jgi:hypothetical protein